MDIKEALMQYNRAMDVLESAEQDVQTALAVVKESAGSATVQVGSQLFQVRMRKDRLYLCEITSRPRGRPKGSKNRKTREAEAIAAALNTPQLVPETTGVFEIDRDERDDDVAMLDSSPFEQVG